MRIKTVLCAVVANAIFFASGIAIGQRGVSKFDRYLKPAVRTEMDWIALKANVDSMREFVPMTDDISIPEVFFNNKENRPQASVVISSGFEKAPLSAVRTRISQKYYLTYYQLKNEIPELLEDDFVLSVFLNAPGRKLFAECKHGNIVFF